MSIYAHIKRCLELSDRDITSAIADRRLAKALLDQLAKVSKPSDGAPKLLLMFAKIAAQQVDWIDGALRVELVGDGEVTTVEVLTELGLGMHERVFPSFKMAVPLEEFARAVERVPHMIEPLSIATSSASRLVLTATEGEEEEESENDSPSANVPIADESMYAGEKRTASKDKMAAVRVSSSSNMRAVRKASKPEMAAVSVPKVIASRSGKTLRPAPPQPSAPRAAPVVVPRAPALPRAEQKAAEQAAASEPKRSIVARVPLARIQVPRSSAGGSRPPPPKAASAPKAPPAPKRPSKPPAKRASMKPPPSSRGGRPSKMPPPKAPSIRPPRSVPPKSKRGHAVSEPPDEESIDTGWDDES